MKTLNAAYLQAQEIARSNVKRLVASQSKTVTEIARFAGLKPRTLQAFLAGDYFAGLQTICCLADTFGLEPWELFRRWDGEKLGQSKM